MQGGVGFCERLKIVRRNLEGRKTLEERENDNKKQNGSSCPYRNDCWTPAKVGWKGLVGVVSFVSTPFVKKRCEVCGVGE